MTEAAAKKKQPQLITVENQQTQLGPRDLFNVIWSTAYAVSFFYNRSAWVTDGHTAPGHVVCLPKGARPPAGAWNLILLDTSDQAGALGYHDDEHGDGIPYSDVFVKTSIEDGEQASVVAVHEAIEMLVDPHVNNPWVEPDPAQGGRQYIVEACDAVQGSSFDVGAPEGRETGTLVANFCLPAWWGLKQTGTKDVDFRGALSKPFEVGSGGYISWLPAGEDPATSSDWHQIFGSERAAELPAWASRLPRIHGGR